MADNQAVDNGSLTDYNVASDKVTYSGDADQNVQLIRIVGVTGAEGTKTVTDVPSDATNGLLVNLGGNNDVTITGSVTVADGGGTLTVDDGGLTISVDDGAGSLTVDNGTLAVVGGGLEATALRVTIASDSTGVLSVDDNGATLSIDDGGGSITIDGTVSVSGAVDTELPAAAALADNAANPTAPAVGAFTMVWDGVTWDRASGNATDGLLVNLGTNNDVTVTGTVTANLAAGTNNVGDVDVASVPAPLSTTGGGTEATALRVTLASDSTGVVSVDDNGASLTVDGTITANAGTGTFAVSDNGGSLTVDNGGTFAVQPGPSTSGGLSIFRSIDLDETEEEAKATAGQVYGWYIANTATATRFVKFYNATAATVVVGTTTPVMTLAIPGNSTDDVAANALGGMGITFDTAITVAATTGVADADVGAPGANEVIVNIFYK